MGIFNKKEEVFMKPIPLQHKILFGYIILLAVIGSMAAILLHERTRIREIAAVRLRNSPHLH